MNISLRIQTLIKHAKTRDSTTYWDLCCDQAHIAESLATELTNKQVIAVDVIEDIIEKAKNRLVQKYSYIPNENSFLIYSTKCKVLLKNAKNINPNSGDTLILAGIGGILCAEILQSLKKDLLSKNLFFIFCVPQQKQQLRKFLIENHFELEAEELVTENDQFHEIMSGCFTNEIPKNPVTFFGKFWKNLPEHHHYYEKLYNHYSKNKSDKYNHELKLLKDIKFLD
ncbi:MAG: tRNA (adenine(22)-N(1))-methyltransferase TrmK [Bacteriovoracaceae bacterium]|nr:tRNA (adenine(22)-N(1))-methyltransferase TrmK [Bacteriovoracaceae bacterium]